MTEPDLARLLSEIHDQPAVVERTLLHCQHAARRRRFAVLAYCLMPDHAHFLVEGFSSDADLRKFVNLAKQCSSYHHVRSTGEALWQDGYYDRVLRDSEDSKWVARYIAENPVRAGLVESPRDYQYLGSAVWTIDELLE